MSSPQVFSNRKRRFDFDASVGDDSENELPVKVKKYNGTSYLSHIVAARFSKFVSWISDLPVKEYFISAVRMGSVLPEQVIEDEDDDDEVAVIGIRKMEPSTNNRSLRTNPFTKLRSQNNYTRRKFSGYGDCSTSGSSAKGFNSTDLSMCPLSSSTPLNTSLKNYSHKPYNFRSSTNSHIEPHESINGSASIDWKDSSRFHSQNSVSGQWHRSKNVKRPSQISYPDTDIEILLDTHTNMHPKGEEIEILSEIPIAKQPTALSRALRSSTSNAVSTLNGRMIPLDVISTNESASPAHGSQNARKTYAADELVRLQERAQYQLLLEKYIKGPHYFPTYRKLGSQNAEVQVDLTDDEPVVVNHFKKSFSKQRADVDKFLHQYYKPCALVKHDSNSQLKQSNEKLPESIEILTESDDELEIVEMKLPEYKPRYKARPDFFSSEWIQELKETVNAEAAETRKIVHEREREVERYRKERAALRAAEMKKRGQIKLDGGVLESKIDEEIEFPELTSEMEAAIDNALIPYPQEEVLCQYGEYKILRKDMDTLSGLNWLNDEIINFYMFLIAERNKSDNYPSVYIFNSFFYTSLKGKGFSSVKRWTRKVDIFANDFILVPIHLGVHWCLAVIDQINKNIQYYDSMGSADDNALLCLRDYVIEEMKDKKKELIDLNTYSLEIVQDIPRQMNGSDCGMFTLKYAEYITRNAEITFSQKHMQYFRRRMVYEILTKQLL